MKKGAKICLFILLSLLAACTPTTEAEPTPELIQDFAPMISVTGELLPETWATIGAQSGGVVVEVLVKSGSEVSEGDVLVRLDDTDARLAIQQAEAALDVAEAQLERLEAGPQAEEIKVAEAQVEAARTAISQTIAQRGQLYAGGLEGEIASIEAQIAAAQADQLVARQQHDDTMKCYDVRKPDGSTDKVCPTLGTLEEQARYALNAANKRLEAAETQLRVLESTHWAQVRTAETGIAATKAQEAVAQAQLELLSAGAASGDIAVAQASVTQAKAAVDAAQVALARTEVKAPFAGTIGLVNVRKGEFITPGQPLITLGDLNTLRVETTDLDEIDVAHVKLDQIVTVTFDALPDRTFNGRVTHIAPMADPGGGGVNYTVIIVLDEIDPVLRWGMTAFIDIEG